MSKIDQTPAGEHIPPGVLLIGVSSVSRLGHALSRRNLGPIVAGLRRPEDAPTNENSGRAGHNNHRLFRIR
jgi:hypothetical protein